ncbi:MAG: hypothetical protein ACFFAY_09385 [Promethearchaeota archaeon]
MSDIDYLGGKYLILDRSRMQLSQLGFSIAAILFLIAYALLLRELCSYENTPFTSFLLLSFQVAVGITATRLSQILGQKSGDYLSIIDPSLLIGEWKSVEVDVPLGTISQLFERFTNSVRTSEKVADDIIDIAWFIVITWSVISSALVVAFESFRLFCMLGAFALGIASALCYHNGFQTGSKKNFDEDLEHLGYYIMARLSEIFKYFEGADIIAELRLLISRKKMVLSDAGVSLKSGNEIRTSVYYWIGLTSDRVESIEIRDSTNEEIRAGMEKLPIVVNLNWNQGETPSGFILHNPSNNISLHNPSTYLTRTAAAAEGVETVVASIASICNLARIPLPNSPN